MKKLKLSLVFLLVIGFIIVGCASGAVPTPPAPTSMPAAEPSAIPTEYVWKIPVGTNPIFRAVHMDGNTGTNKEGAVRELPEEYFEWLRDINVNWVGLSTELHVDDSMDSTVELKCKDVEVPTFTDQNLINAIREFRKHGFNVYLTLNIDPAESLKAEHPVNRWMLGDPDIYTETDILPEFWPWALDHPDHERFVAEFWKTYTEQAVHFAKIAEEEGVGLYSLGTETDRLFRTRPSGVGADDFGDEIRHMVEEVRKTYSGLVTYDQHYESLIRSDWYPSVEFWEDAGLDIIGISAYFPLADNPPKDIMSVEELESRWESIFNEYLIPLRETYPDKPILFTEFGYTTALTSPFKPNTDEFTMGFILDEDGNGFDDGQEAQANIYEALFHVMDRHPGVLNGAFLWGNYMAGDQQWSESNFRLRGFDIRWKLSEALVREQYCAWLGNACAKPAEPAMLKPWPTLAANALAATPTHDGQVLYDDQLATGWKASEYLSTVDLKSSDTTAQGASSIKVSALEAWGSLKLTYQQAVDTSDYKWLMFQINPGKIENISLSVTIFSGKKNLTYVFIEDLFGGKPIPTNQWTKVFVPLEILNPAKSSFDSFYFELGTKEPGVFYLDDISLIP